MGKSSYTMLFFTFMKSLVVRQRQRCITGLSFIAIYFIMVLYATVFSRETFLSYRFDPIPFTSYQRYYETDVLLFKWFEIREILTNIIMFVPIGFSLGFVLKKPTCWKEMVIGFGLSMVIEVLQLLMQRGVCEVNDLIHNTVGCLIGYGIFVLLIGLNVRLSK